MSRLNTCQSFFTFLDIESGVRLNIEISYIGDPISRQTVVRDIIEVNTQTTVSNLKPQDWVMLSQEINKDWSVKLDQQEIQSDD